MKELVTTTASITTAFKNVYDISNGFLIMRKQHKWITSGQLRQLSIAINRALEEKRMSGMHSIMTKGRGYLIDSMNQIQDYVNTDFGDMLLESVRDEVRYYSGYCEDYDRHTRPGGFK